MIAILLSSIIFFTLYLLYIAVLKGLTFFQANRAYLIGSVIFSSVAPWIKIPATVITLNAMPANELPLLVLSSTLENQSPAFVEWLSGLYLFGVIIGTVITVVSLWKVNSILSISRKVKHHISNYLTSEGNHAFSFLNLIQIGDEMDEETRDMVLTHEMVHKNQWHSLDVVIMTISRVIFWFNPFMHLAAKELQLVHEYIADEKTQTAFGPAYQHTLLNQVMGTKLFPMTNTFFNKSLLKNRIIMMNKQQSKTWRTSMYVLIIPIAAAGIWLSSCSDQPIVDEVLGAKQVDVAAEFPGGQDALLAYYKDGFEYPEKLKEANVEGRVQLSFVVNEDGELSDIHALSSDNELLDEPAIAFVKKMPNWTPAQKDGRAVKSKMVLPIMYTMN